MIDYYTYDEARDLAVFNPGQVFYVADGGTYGEFCYTDRLRWTETDNDGTVRD